MKLYRLSIRLGDNQYNGVTLAATHEEAVTNFREYFDDWSQDLLGDLETSVKETQKKVYMEEGI
jgi:hypothetical protein